MPHPAEAGQEIFKAVLPEEIDWKPFDAFPDGARLAVMAGNPMQAGPYVIRVKLPAGTKMMPHSHREDRIYTVMSGIFYVGRGLEFDEARLVAYPPGTLITLPRDEAHFHFARSGEYVTQITAIGPLGLEYLNPAHDPRNCPERQ